MLTGIAGGETLKAAPSLPNISRVKLSIKTSTLRCSQRFLSAYVYDHCGHTREVQGLHCLTAAFEDGADRRILLFVPG
jgi:hypothetical protein